MPSTSSETNFITRLPAVRLPKSLTNIAPMTTATFPNAIVPLIINTTAFLLIAATKGSRKTVMPPVTGCTLPAVTVRVRETPPSPIPEVAEARPPTTAETPVIILINPVVIPVPAKPGAHAALIPVPTAAAAPAPVVLLARLPLLPAQAARHRPPVRVLLLVPGVRAPLLQALPVHLPPAAEVRDPPAGAPVFREEALPVPENRLVRAMKNRPEAAKTVPEQHFIPARKKGQHASPAEALPVPGRLPPAQAIKPKNLPARIVREQLTIPARPKPARLKHANIPVSRPVQIGPVRPVPGNVPTARLIPGGTAAIQNPARPKRATLHVVIQLTVMKNAISGMLLWMMDVAEHIKPAGFGSRSKAEVVHNFFIFGDKLNLGYPFASRRCMFFGKLRK